MNVPARPPPVLQRLWMPQGMALGTGAKTISKPMAAWIALLLGLALVGCGHRIVRVRWIERTNKESGVPDIGIQADWVAITERR